MMKMNLTIKDYILSGGIRHIKPYSEFTMNDFLNLATEDNIWSENINVNIITFPLSKDADFIISFNKENAKYISDCIEIDVGLLNKNIEQIKKRGLFFSEQFKQCDFLKQITIIDEVFDDEEKVLFLSNGINMHFIKSKKVNDYLIMKIASNGEMYRSQIKKILIGSNSLCKK